MPFQSVSLAAHGNLYSFCAKVDLTLIILNVPLVGKRLQFKKIITLLHRK